MEALHALAARYVVSFPAEAAHCLETIPRRKVAALLSDLEPDTVVAVVENMLPATVAAVFETMDRKTVAAILEHLPVSRCVLIMRSVGKVKRGTFTGLLPKRNAAAVERLVRSAEDSAGVLTEPAPAVISPEMSVIEAQHIVKEVNEPYVYVVDAEQRLVGVMQRKELAKSDGRARIGNIMSRQVIRLPSSAPRSAVRNHRAWAEYDQLPVIDGNGFFVGVVRHRSIRRAGQMRQTASPSHRAALATFLDIGELYWGGLSSVLTAMAGRQPPKKAAEVKNVD